MAVVFLQRARDMRVRETRNGLENGKSKDKRGINIRPGGRSADKVGVPKRIEQFSNRKGQERQKGSCREAGKRGSNELISSGTGPGILTRVTWASYTDKNITNELC